MPVSTVLFGRMVSATTPSLRIVWPGSSKYPAEFCTHARYSALAQSAPPIGLGSSPGHAYGLPRYRVHASSKRNGHRAQLSGLAT
jgi:hypothetical protein